MDSEVQEAEVEVGCVSTWNVKEILDVEVGPRVRIRIPATAKYRKSSGRCLDMLQHDETMLSKWRSSSRW